MARFVRTYWSALLLAGVAVIVIITAILSATAFRPASHISAKLPVDGQSLAVTSKANVLTLLNKSVNIHATAADGATVTIAVGRSSDVEAWAQNRPHSEITGLDSWTQLQYRTIAAAEDADPLEKQDLSAGKDMWLDTASGEGETDLTWTEADYPTSLVVYADGKSKVDVQLSWDRKVSTPLLWPLLIIGLVMLIAAGILFYILMKLHQHAKAHPKPVEETPQAPQIEVVGEGEDRRPTRKSLRQAREAGQEVVVVDGKEFPTGMIPKIVVPEETDATQSKDEAEGEAPESEGSAAGDLDQPPSNEDVFVADTDSTPPAVVGEEEQPETFDDWQMPVQGEGETDSKEFDSDFAAYPSRPEFDVASDQFAVGTDESDDTQVSEDYSEPAEASEPAVEDADSQQTSAEEESPYDGLTESWISTVRKWNS